MNRFAWACGETNLYGHVEPPGAMEVGQYCEVAGEIQSELLVDHAWRVGNVAKTISGHGGKCMRFLGVRYSVSKVRMLDGVMNLKGLLS
jgi:hypothetical protein